jgi:hypothetical protein
MANQQGLLIIERILRDRGGIWRQIAEERSLKDLSAQMLVSSAISLAVYGAVIGASNGFAQALSSAVKLPLLFLATLAICLPTLYLFNLLFGARLSMMQAVALIMVSITVTAVLTLAFAPISLFFLISAHNYSFLKLLNVAILVLTAIIGLRFLIGGMATINAHHAWVAAQETEPDQPRAVEADDRDAELDHVAGNGTTGSIAALPAAAAAPGTGPVGAAVATRTAPVPVQVGSRIVLVPATSPAGLPAQPVERPASMTLLYIWILLFGFVGTQLGWTLRPFFGSPNEPFQLFRNLEGTFYGDLFRTIGHFFGG